ncbi:replication protein P [Serratia odorifera]|uniref:Replication protein P n=2 Tax=Serratia odorifera TaxID=618 RepID=D4DVV4_SEROD|nr:replication protein P [Serratia odorifera]EFE98257.1 replication protein P [Serratia odorifera DSM 4582]PNK92689.1 DNA replication protein [Serratia odorifera]RII73842.1 DNA replication protein [Serratia odorifera]VDZ51543.1 Replication protein P [Serratia odorifera]
MNKLMQAVQSRDAGTLARMMPSEPAQRVVNNNAEKLVDLLFKNLMQIFPAARNTALSTPEDIAAAKRQWILAFAENGITTADQLRAGMRMARQQESDFWPSCGKFIGWCKAGAAEFAGLPSLDEAVTEFDKYAATRSQYPSAEEFPWSHPAMYWIVIDVRRAMHRYNHTEAETRRAIQNQLNGWAKRLAKGEPVPTPAAQIAAPKTPTGPTPAQLLLAEYERRKKEGWL